MPLTNKTKGEIIKKIKEEQNPTTQLQLIGLFDLLLKIYNEDDRFDKITRAENFKYHQKMRDFFYKAISIMNGNLQVCSSMLKNPERFFTQQEMQSEEFQNPIYENQNSDFWLKLLLTVDLFESVITEKDKQVLKHLNKLDIIKYEDSDNYTVEFYFNENQFFENEKLSLTVHIDDDDDDLDLNIVELRGDIIEWKEQQNYLVQIVNEEEQRMENSFFWFFKSFKAVDFEQGDDQSCVEIEMDDISDNSLFEISKDVAGIFRDYFMVYLIPSLFGIDIPQFQENIDDYESYEGDKQQNTDEKIKNNLCQTQ